LTVNVGDKNVIELVGVCPLEEAERLLQCLLEHGSATVDWRKCEQAHTAVIQVLLASNCSLRGPPVGTFLKDHVEAVLMGNRG
jgi:hypothetical protein